MFLKIFNDDNTIKQHLIKKELFYDEQLKESILYINSSSKEENALRLFKAYYSGAKAILFDNTNKSIESDLNHLKLEKSKDNIFSKYNYSYIFFTSGTTGHPLGALKTKDNIEEEIKTLTKLLSKYSIKRVIVTVPFIHFYGALLGFMFPFLNNIDIILKEHFLPNDLLNIIDENSLVVTTPLYIKALNRVQRDKDLSGSIFISSTAPLFPEISKEFNNKFSTDIIQLFGSTETGGIAYKINDAPLWEPLGKVEISTNSSSELNVDSPYNSHTIYENGLIKELPSKIQTFDYVDIINNKFRLVGRSSQIIKVAGKRYSTLQIESILEAQESIKKAVVTVSTNKDELRGDRLNIIIESDKTFLVKEIKSIIKKELSNLKFSIDLKIVKEIKTTAVGKKVTFL